MSCSSSKTPPALSQSKTYEDWLKLFKIWRMYTELPKKRQGPALVLPWKERHKRLFWKFQRITLQVKMV